MRVLHISNVAGKRRGGGIHEVLVNVLGYQSLEMNVDLWFPGSKSEAKEFINIEAIPIDTFAHYHLGLIKRPLYLNKRARKYSLIHQHGIWLPISLIGNSKSTIKIVQPHGLLLPNALKISKWKKTIAFILFESSNIKSCRILLACSYFEFKALRERFPSKDIAVIPNGISDDFFNYEPNYRYFEKPIYRGRKTLLFLSRLHTSKGLDILLESFSSIDVMIRKEWNLVIVGDGDQKYLDSLQHLVTSLNIHDSTFFLGACYGEEKAEIMASADIFVLPSKTENFGIVVVESLAMQTPVLTSTSTPWDNLRKWNCGNCVELNVYDFKVAMEELMSLSKDELKHLGQNGREWVEREFLWSKISKQFIQLYTWLLNPKLPRPRFVHVNSVNSKSSAL